jgi:lambda family phage tail tape measure protein
MALIDNKDKNMRDALTNALSTADQMDVMTGYFYFSGFEQLAEAVADGLTGQFERLKEFGVKVSKDNDQFVVRMADGSKTIVDSAQAVVEVLRQQGEGAGKFANVVAGPLSQAFSNLRGAIFEATSSIGEGFAPVLADLSASMSKFVKDNSAIFEALGKQIGEVLTLISENMGTLVNVVKVLGAVFAVNLLSSLGKAAIGFITIGRGMGTLTGSAKGITNSFGQMGKIIDRFNRGTLGTRGGGGLFAQMSKEIVFLFSRMGSLILSFGGAIAAGYALGTMIRSALIPEATDLSEILGKVNQSLKELNAEQLKKVVIDSSSTITELNAKVESLTAAQKAASQVWNAATSSAVGAYQKQIDAVNELLDAEYYRRNQAKLALEGIRITVQEAKVTAAAAEIAKYYNTILQEAADRKAELLAKDKADAERTQQGLAGLREQVALLKMNTEQQAVYNAIKSLGNNATEEEIKQAEDLAKQILDLTAGKDAEAEATRALTAAEAELNNIKQSLNQAYQDSLSGVSAFMKNKEAEYKLANDLISVYGVQRTVLTELAEFDRERTDNLEKLKVAAEAANAAEVDDAWAKYYAMLEIYESERERFRKQAEEQATSQRDFSTGWQKAFSDYADSATNAADYAATMFSTFTDGMTNAIVNFAETGKLSFKSMFADMLKEVIKFHTNKIVMSLLGGADGTGGGLASMFGNLFGKRANGGPVSPGGSYLVGERGPEYFVPRQAGNIVPNGQMGGNSTTVTYNIQAVDAASFRDLVSRDPEFIYAVSQKGARRYA